MCRDIEEVDGENPQCRTLAGCPVLLDRFGRLERKAIQVRNALMTSGSLLGHEAIHRRYCTDEATIDLITAIDDEYARIKAENPQHAEQ